MCKEQSFLETTLSRLPGGIVLDVASGGGNFALSMENCFTECDFITTVDTSLGPLKHIADRLHSRKLIPAVMDGRLLGFKDGAFNTVAISNSLHHLNNPKEILQEMKRTLAPGGHFLIKEMFSDGNQTQAQITHTLLHNWWAAVDSLNGVVHNSVFTESYLKLLADNIGLESLDFFTVEDLSGDPFDPDLTSHLKNTFDAYMKRTGDRQDIIDLGYSTLRHLEKHGFCGARSLLAVGVKSS